jgi:hypothetical protein
MPLFGTINLSEMGVKDRLLTFSPDFKADAERRFNGFFYCIGGIKNAGRDEVIYDSPKVSICILGKVYLKRGFAMYSSNRIILEENRYAKFIADLYESFGIQALLELTGDHPPCHG